MQMTTFNNLYLEIYQLGKILPNFWNSIFPRTRVKKTSISLIKSLLNLFGVSEMTI